MAIARLTGVSYWYPNGVTASLRDLNLDFEGGLTVVAGPSGGGKSTLLRVLNGLVPHFHGGRIAGVAVVAGMSIAETPTRRLARTVGFVFQDPELQGVYDSVEREVAFGLENIAMPPAEMPARVEEALASAGALHLAGRSIRTLSGGERQRIALASALAMRPQVVVLDEPTSQLDPEGAAMVLSAAADLAAQGRAVIVSEHRLEHLVALANVLVTIDGGCASLVDISAWRQPDPPPARPCSAPAGREAWSLDGVAAAFGNRSVFEGVDAAGHEGEVVVLTGPNGGGKTTLLRLIAGAIQPRTGRIERRPGRIAYLPQNPTALLHRPTLRAEVALTLERSGEPESPDVILDALGLLPVAGRYPRDLSCGERQRAALAAVLPGTPRLVLLDEPTRGMDVAARDALIALVGRLRDAGSSIVIATHDAVLRRSLGDTVLRVAEGRVDQARAEVATA